MKKPTKKLSHSEECILVFALRYALGRNTTAPGIVIGELDKNWGEIMPNTRRQIIREVNNWMDLEVSQFKKEPHGFEKSSYYEWKKFLEDKP